MLIIFKLEGDRERFRSVSASFPMRTWCVMTKGDIIQMGRTNLRSDPKDPKIIEGGGFWGQEAFKVSKGFGWKNFW